MIDVEKIKSKRPAGFTAYMQRAAKAMNDFDVVYTDVAKIREIAGMTQTEFADALGYSMDHVNHVECGKTPLSDKFINKLLDFVATSEKFRGNYERIGVIVLKSVIEEKNKGK